MTSLTNPLVIDIISMTSPLVMLFSLSLAIISSISRLLFIDKPPMKVQVNPSKLIIWTVDSSHKEVGWVRKLPLQTEHGAYKVTPSCSYPDHFCNPSGDDLIETVGDPNVTSVQDCSKHCTVNTLCTHFTFFNYRHKPVCHLLKECSEKFPVCSSPASCVSGPKSCDGGGAGEVCAKLALVPGHLARWTCDGVNPYKEDIPVGTTCQAMCPSWKNVEGETVTAYSSCLAGRTWSSSSPIPTGYLVFPHRLNKPDEDDMLCQPSHHQPSHHQPSHHQPSHHQQTLHPPPRRWRLLRCSPLKKSMLNRLQSKSNRVQKLLHQHFPRRQHPLLCV